MVEGCSRILAVNINDKTIYKQLMVSLVKQLICCFGLRNLLTDSCQEECDAFASIYAAVVGMY